MLLPQKCTHLCHLWCVHMLLPPFCIQIHTRRKVPSCHQISMPICVTLCTFGSQNRHQIRGIWAKLRPCGHLSPERDTARPGWPPAKGRGPYPKERRRHMAKWCHNMTQVDQVGTYHVAPTCNRVGQIPTRRKVPSGVTHILDTHARVPQHAKLPQHDTSGTNILDTTCQVATT